MTRSAPEDVDVVVVGAGPGGCTAATLIARAGHRVLVLERDRFPRHQIGESLLPSTVHAIATLLGVAGEIHGAGSVRKLAGPDVMGQGARVQAPAQLGPAAGTEPPVFADGLVSSPDGLHWRPAPAMTGVRP